MAKLIDMIRAPIGDDVDHLTPTYPSPRASLAPARGVIRDVSRAPTGAHINVLRLEQASSNRTVAMASRAGPPCRDLSSANTYARIMEHGFAHLEETPHSQRHERLEEPLFIPADDMDDDHLVMDMMTSRGGVENEHQETEMLVVPSHSSGHREVDLIPVRQVPQQDGSHDLHYNLGHDLPSANRRRSRDDDDEDYIEYVGRFEPRRRIQHQSEVIEVEDASTPLREMSDGVEEICHHCGQSQATGPAEGNGRGRGSGSTTLSLRVRASLLALLLGRQSLFNRLQSTQRGINSWADIAEMVGARREDFDRVRHAASWMQTSLPGMMARGMF